MIDASSISCLAEFSDSLCWEEALYSLSSRCAEIPVIFLSSRVSYKQFLRLFMNRIELSKMISPPCSSRRGLAFGWGHEISALSGGMQCMLLSARWNSRYDKRQSRQRPTAPFTQSKSVDNRANLSALLRCCMTSLWHLEDITHLPRGQRFRQIQSRWLNLRHRPLGVQ